MLRSPSTTHLNSVCFNQLFHVQLAIERNRPMIVVGTPGRVSQMMRSGVLRVHRTPLLVLDEVRDVRVFAICCIPAHLCVCVCVYCTF
jgi:hypothetical protein